MDDGLAHLGYIRHDWRRSRRGFGMAEHCTTRKPEGSQDVSAMTGVIYWK
jgi:hypothetical protein